MLASTKPTSWVINHKVFSPRCTGWGRQKGGGRWRSCANLLNSKVMNSSSLSDSWNAAEPKPTALSGCSPCRFQCRGERMAWGEGAHPVAHPWAPCGEEGRAFWVIFCPYSPRAARKTAHGTALPCTHHTWPWARNGCSPTLAHPYPHPRASARHGVPRIAEPRNIRFLQHANKTRIQDKVQHPSPKFGYSSLLNICN